ncbi:helix-turn-helix domain-containing protein [Aestuariivirga sp.]|uniref:helix-turn-helix domain-containing protein n=1 Tax=Aestuariivirga sp. TaxID=2650926 RepID=UPI00391C0909
MMREQSVDRAQEAEAEADQGQHLRERPDGGVDPAGEAGWFLARERIERGLTLEEAGEATGIHPYHLEAIEFGDMTHMPGRMDALEMIGVYAEFLGFDPEPLLLHYMEFLPAEEPAPEPRHPANPAPLSSAKILFFGKLPKLPRFRLSRVPGGAGGLVASLAGAMLLFAGVSYMLMPGGGEPGQGEISVIDEPAPEADPMPTASTGPEMAEVTLGEEPMPEDETLANAELQSGDDDLAGTGLDGISSLIQENVPGAEEAAKTLQGMAAAEDVSQSAQGREFGSDNGESRLTLKARAPVWVRIEDSRGNVVMTQMLMKGDTYRVPNREGLVVIARDGGLLSYLIDGKEKGILGTPGEILVGRSLDLKSFEG